MSSLVLSGDPFPQGPAVVTTFNAGKLTAREVAATFVPPTSFERLYASANTILGGPRGSGKTTLLKMLTPEALTYWDADEASAARARVQYTAVFVGADRTWNAQLLSESLSEPFRTRLAWAAFTTHVCTAVVAAMADKIATRDDGERPRHLPASMNAESEEAVSSEIAILLGLDETPPHLGHVARLLRRRLVEIGTFKRRLLYEPSAVLPDWVDLDPIPVVEAAVDVFNSAAGQSGHLWCLLFDELELAPSAITDSLLRTLRGSHPSILLKLSLSPINELLRVNSGASGATMGQDFEFIQLTSARRGRNADFGRDLMLSYMRRQEPGLRVSPYRLLGESQFDGREFLEEPGSEGGRTGGTKVLDRPYQIGSALWKKFAELADQDPSFAAWLERSGVDLYRLDDLTGPRRASTLRKVRNLVVVRHAYRRQSGSRRSRKDYSLYTGARTVLSLPDGNPRMLISLMRHLLDLASIDGSRSRVDQAKQSLAIESLINRFRALIDAQQAEVLAGGQTLSLSYALDEIGSYFAGIIVREPFTANPPLSFSVDAKTPRHWLPILARGINTGALIHIPKTASQRPLSSVAGETFRLTHMLAPYYGLPPILGRSVSFSSILDSSRSSGVQSRAKETVEIAPSLFDVLEDPRDA